MKKTENYTIKTSYLALKIIYTLLLNLAILKNCQTTFRRMKFILLQIKTRKDFFNNLYSIHIQIYLILRCIGGAVPCCYYTVFNSSLTRDTVNHIKGPKLA